MRRALATVLVLAAAAVVAVLGAGAGGSSAAGEVSYKVELDSAFGLVGGADVKIAGVRAGKVSGLDVDRRTSRALVTFSIDAARVGGLRRDVFCEVRPQSLIGEYFLDCRPGTSPRRLPPGSTIPVTQTGSTIPADVIADIMRRPYRDRFRIILSELGAGLAARGPDVNATIRRALPALRQTDTVLRQLADNRRVLARLASEAGDVLGRLSARRREVGRFVREAGQAAQASAERSDALAATFRRFPGFLGQLTPTLRNLEVAARRQTPALRDLRVSAPRLTTFFERLGPFSRATLPAVRSLGRASVTGLQAARAARPQVRRLRRFAGRSVELAGNLAIVLKDLDDRGRAVQKIQGSPNDQGYTGLEALLVYLFDQALSINIYDQRGHLLKINLLTNECTNYRDAASVRADPQLRKKCNGYLGPNQPGITTPDPTAGGAAGTASGQTPAAARAAGILRRVLPARAPGAGAQARLVDYLLGA